MIGHSREILSTLGIDVWVSREVLAQEMPSSTIWRDINTYEPIVDLNQNTDVIEIGAPQDLSDLTSFDDFTEIAKPEVKAAKAESLTEVVEAPIRPRIDIEAFNIQALILPHVVILIDGTAITADQQKLWINIQRGIHAEFSELNWPFALPELQDGYGVNNFIQGFMDSIALDKTVLALGNIPHYQKSNITYLANLQEMLEEPLLKKRLWSFIQNKGN
jgi:hypothetical protein